MTCRIASRLLLLPSDQWGHTRRIDLDDVQDSWPRLLGPNGTQVAPAHARIVRRGESQLFSVRSAVKPIPRRLGAGGLVSSRIAERMAVMASS
jgi:hypothetical protein